MPARTVQRSHLIIVDSDRLLPEDLRKAIQTHREWSVAGKGSRRKPTVALLVVAGDEQPSALIRRFYTSLDSIPMIVYDTTPATHRQANAFNAGASGYIIPGITLSEFAPIIELARHGGYGLSPSVIPIIREQMRAPLGFSRREQEVVALFALGANLHSIAEELQITYQAAEEALVRACNKAGVDSPVTMVMLWTRWTVTDDSRPEYGEEIAMPRYAMTA